MPELSLYVHHLAVVEDILGPGRRLAVWTTGCPFHCQGCIEPELRELTAGTAYSVGGFFQQISPLLNTLKTITFSGGEPLYQQEALRSLLHKIRQQDIDTMLYTGMNTSRFMEQHRDFHPFIDICVTEPFVQAQHGNHLWRGSANQEILSPSGKYGTEQLGAWMKQPSAGIDIHFDEQQCHTYGIPAPGCMEQIEQAYVDKSILIK